MSRKPTSKAVTDLKAGHCTRCRKCIWRTATAQKQLKGQRIDAGKKFLLWPEPTSMYVVVHARDGQSLCRGIAFCPKCVPAIGEPVNAKSAQFEHGAVVLQHELAYERYKAWFAPHRRVFLEAWLKDAMSYDDKKIRQVLDQWEKDGGRAE